MRVTATCFGATACAPTLKRRKLVHAFMFACMCTMDGSFSSSHVVEVPPTLASGFFFLCVARSPLSAFSLLITVSICFSTSAHVAFYFEYELCPRTSPWFVSACIDSYQCWALHATRSASEQCFPTGPQSPTPPQMSSGTLRFSNVEAVHCAMDGARHCPRGCRRVRGGGSGKVALR